MGCEPSAGSSVQAKTSNGAQHWQAASLLGVMVALGADMPGTSNIASAKHGVFPRWSLYELCCIGADEVPVLLSGIDAAFDPLKQAANVSGLTRRQLRYPVLELVKPLASDMLPS